MQMLPDTKKTYEAAFSRLGRTIDLLEDEVRLARRYRKTHALISLEQINARVEELQSLMEMLERNKDG